MARRVLHLRPRGSRRSDAAAGGKGESGDAECIDALATHRSDADPSGEAAEAPVLPADDRPAADETPPAKRRRRSRRAPSNEKIASRHDAFGDRLRDLEREIEEALAGAAAANDSRVVTAAREAAEELLAFYADLARAFRRGGAGDVLIRLRMIGTADEVDDFGRDPAFVTRVAPILEFLYERWWRVELRGTQHVPRGARVLLVANHSGGFLPYDGLMLAHALRTRLPDGGREVRPLIEDFVYGLPWVGPLLTRLGAVRASAGNVERLLAGEHAVAVFPEGVKGVGKYYRDRYRLQRFARGGFVALALRTGAPIVPVAIIGGEEIHPVIAKWQWLARALQLPYFPVTPTFPWLGALGLVPLPTKWHIVFGTPLDFAAEHGRDAATDDLLVNRLKEQVRERIQRMVVEALRTRDSVFAG
jgi:1-acyl-sn-glycerol-3-phosphate acyltransferase